MPNSAPIQRRSVLLAHLAEEIFAYIARSAGVSAEQFAQLAASTSLLALSDTPDAYSTGKYLRSGAAGATWEDAIPPDGSIGAVKLADGAVSTIKLADGAVTDTKIVGGAVHAGHVAVNAIETPAIVDAAVTDAKIGNRMADDATSHASLTGTLTQLVSLLAKLIKGITGKSSALTAPATTLEAVNTHYSQKATSSTLGHVKVSGGATGINIDPTTGEISVNTTFPAGGGLASRLTYWVSATQIDDSAIIIGALRDMLGFGVTPSSAVIEIVRSDAAAGVSVDHSGGGAGPAVEGYHSSGNAIQGEATTGRGGDFLATGAGDGMRAQNNSTGYASRHSKSGSSTTAALRTEGTHAGPDMSIQGGIVHDLVQAFNANLALTARHRTILVSTSTAAVTLTLPPLAAALDGIEYHIIDVGNNLSTNNLTIRRDPTTSDVFLDNATSLIVSANRAYWLVRAVKDGAGNRKWSIYKHAYGA